MISYIDRYEFAAIVNDRVISLPFHNLMIIYFCDENLITMKRYKKEFLYKYLVLVQLSLLAPSEYSSQLCSLKIISLCLENFRENAEHINQDNSCM